MSRLFFLVLPLVFSWSSFTESFDRNCDPSDPVCRRQILMGQTSRRQGDQVIPRPVNRNCNYQDIWLMPGNADGSCTRKSSAGPIIIDPRQITIRPAIIKFPGCFNVEIKNVQINAVKEKIPDSILAKVEYQWLNIPEFSSVGCQNASIDGCGGLGNNCYYCDVCDSLEGLGRSHKSEDTASREINQQLSGLNCPRSPGVYTFRKQLCFNTWEAFDKNRNCRPDFLESEEGDLKTAVLSLQQGTVIAKVRLAYNASEEVANKVKTKLVKIENSAEVELEKRRKSGAITNSQFEEVKKSFIESKKGAWHRDEYLPWLVVENELACFKIPFNVCERPPQRRSGGMGFTCE